MLGLARSELHLSTKLPMSLLTDRYDMTILISLICDLDVEAKVIFVRSVVVLDILHAALLFCDLKDVHFERAVVLLELIWFIAYLSAEILLHQEIRGFAMPPM
jgi:hypothetical protein